MAKTNRDSFIEDVEGIISKYPDMFSPEALAYFNSFKDGKASVGGMTEVGGKVLAYMQENEETYNNIFKSKEIGEGIFMSGRSVSGSMRKLVTDGYVEKVGTNPVCYGLTGAGRDYQFDKM